jgi:hypothetical protein
MVSRIFVSLAFVLCCSLSYSEESKQIPLDLIWALDMPGTNDVRELEPEIYSKRGKGLPIEKWRELQAKSLIAQIYPQLSLENTRIPKRGFAVPGTGLAALQAARDVLTEEREVSNLLPAETDITIVFSSLQSGDYVHIYAVERHANVIEIRYRFAPHEEAYVSQNFALVPIGKLPKGMYQVKFTQGPMEEKYLNAGFRPKTGNYADKIVCTPFKFSVK